ncbi:unnamed protein product [Sphagnum jensenii]|uniref:Uncharacterized protein n=2 Tax=Sphagnum jensenii TaxID=128206 RepID=A0ABP1A191_9BRYO
MTYSVTKTIACESLLQELKAVHVKKIRGIVEKSGQGLAVSSHANGATSKVDGGVHVALGPEQGEICIRAPEERLRRVVATDV